MSMLDRMLDGDEGTPEKLRDSAKVIIVLTWTIIGIFLLAVLATAVLGLAGIADLDSPWDQMFPLVMLMLVVQLAVTERYRRKRLEERVKALEARSL